MFQQEKEKFELNISNETSSVLKFLGVDGWDVYNTSVPVEQDGKLYMFGRVEKRAEWARSHVCLFEYAGTDTWKKCEDAVEYPLEDPCVMYIDDMYVLCGTHVLYHCGELECFYAYFYAGKDLKHLHMFTHGPKDMKDIRMVQLNDGKIGVFSRPRGEHIRSEYGSESVVGFTVINDLSELSDDVIMNAKVIENLFDKDEWGGCNQCIALKDGKIGVIGHQCYLDGEIQVYTNISFVFDPHTFTVSDKKIIGTRKSYPKTPAKKDFLVDCAFTSGITLPADGKVELYSGIGDVYEGKAYIDDPFGDYRI